MTKQDYLHGECFAFALALHEITGYQPVTFSDAVAGAILVHAALIHPEGDFVDASGRVTLAQKRARRLRWTRFGSALTKSPTTKRAAT